MTSVRKQDDGEWVIVEDENQLPYGWDEKDARDFAMVWLVCLLMLLACIIVGIVLGVQYLLA